MGEARRVPPYTQANRVKGGQKVGIVRESPPNAQAKWVKDGKRVVEEWSKAGQMSGQSMLPQPRISSREITMAIRPAPHILFLTDCGLKVK